MDFRTGYGLRRLGVAAVYPGLRGGLLLYAADDHHALRTAAGTAGNFTRTLAGSIGTSITTTMWTNREALHHAQLTESVTPYNPNAQQMYDQLQGLGMTQQQASGWIAQQITNQGLIISANEIFWFSAAIFILLLGLVWFARPPFSAGGGGGGAH